LASQDKTEKSRLNSTASNPIHLPSKRRTVWFWRRLAVWIWGRRAVVFRFLRRPKPLDMKRYMGGEGSASIEYCMEATRESNGNRVIKRRISVNVPIGAEKEIFDHMLDAWDEGFGEGIVMGDKNTVAGDQINLRAEGDISQSPGKMKAGGDINQKQVQAAESGIGDQLRIEVGALLDDLSRHRGQIGQDDRRLYEDALEKTQSLLVDGKNLQEIAEMVENLWIAETGKSFKTFWQRLATTDAVSTAGLFASIAGVLT